MISGATGSNYVAKPEFAKVETAVAHGLARQKDQDADLKSARLELARLRRRQSDTYWWCALNTFGLIGLGIVSWILASGH